MAKSMKDDYLYRNHEVKLSVLEKGKGCLGSDETTDSPQSITCKITRVKDIGC
jgi:hypothetical protein